MAFFRPGIVTEISAAKRRVESLILNFNPSLIAVTMSEVAASHNLCGYLSGRPHHDSVANHYRIVA
jgi:hypothetical protein